MRCWLLALALFLALHGAVLGGLSAHPGHIPSAPPPVRCLACGA